MPRLWEMLRESFVLCFFFGCCRLIDSRGHVHLCFIWIRLCGIIQSNERRKTAMKGCYSRSAWYLYGLWRVDQLVRFSCYIMNTWLWSIWIPRGVVGQVTHTQRAARYQLILSCWERRKGRETASIGKINWVVDTLGSIHHGRIT